MLWKSSESTNDYKLTSLNHEDETQSVTETELAECEAQDPWLWSQTPQPRVKLHHTTEHSNKNQRCDAESAGVFTGPAFKAECRMSRAAVPALKHPQSTTSVL